MSELETLVASITMTAQYTHSVEDQWGDYDVYDCFLVRETSQVSLYGGDYNVKTLYVKGFGQAPGKSRRACGDNLNPPDVVTVVEAVVADAAMVDGCVDWHDWASTYFGDESITHAKRVEGLYRHQVRLRDEVVDFLDCDDLAGMRDELEELSS